MCNRGVPALQNKEVISTVFSLRKAIAAAEKGAKPIGFGLTVREIVLYSQELFNGLESMWDAAMKQTVVGETAIFFIEKKVVFNRTR